MEPWKLLRTLENALEAAVIRRKQEIQENKDNKCDLLREIVEINADRRKKINSTHYYIVVESLRSI